MSRIKVLDEVTAGQIAAGEIVERPVSVVKELVENSLDAGADQISVEVFGGGIDGITVSDNGCGMSQEEVSLAFYRHATSKITTAADLYSLTTLGFRGEALPSIAAVSYMVLKSKMPGQNAGHEIKVRGGEILSLQPVGCPPGTSVKVSDLFYNTPARRKHLKSRGTESGLIVNMVQNISLSRPGVRFILKHNDKTVFRTTGSGKLVDAVSAVYGVEIAGEMLEVNATRGNVSLKGFVSKPFINRNTRSYITVIINGRYVKNKLVSGAVEAAYKGLIPTGRYPVVALVLNMGPGLLDVNIHPAKMEIRISNGEEIGKFIENTIRQCLNNSVLIPAYSFVKTTRSSGEMLQEGQGTSRNGLRANPGINSGQSQRLAAVKDKNFFQNSLDAFYSSKNNDLKPHQTIFKEDFCRFGSGEGEDVIVFASGERNPGAERVESSFPSLQVVGQLLPTYILAAGADGLYILDQHAAHERILFESFLHSFSESGNQTQMLLNPVPLELNRRTLDILCENMGIFTALGFVLEEFGGETYVLRGVPANLSTGDGVSHFIDLVDNLAAFEREKDFNRALITRLACRAAIKSGEVLPVKAMEAIIEQLSGTAEPYTCPHGRPTLVKITKRQLNQMFKRPN